MNLERIIPQNQDYIVLKKISDFKKLYLCMEIKTTMQKINNGELIEAFPFKDIIQFKGLRPFFLLTEDEIINNVLKDGGIYQLYKTELQIGSVVDYAGLNYDVLGFIVNTYAQWNIPTPLLLNPNNIANDYKGLFQGKMTNFQINQKVNDNFQSGKYDADMLIPLVDANDFKKDIIVVKKRPKESEINIYIAKLGKEKNIKIKTVKNIFIDTIFETNGDEIQKIIEIDKDLYENTRNFINVVNDIINSKIEKQKSISKIEETEDINLDFVEDF